MTTDSDYHSPSTIPEKNAPEMHRSTVQKMSKNRAGESKVDARYWMHGNRLKLHDSANYSVQIQIAGKRVWFPLGTPNKKNAASKAAQIYLFIQGHGLVRAVEKFKPKPQKAADGASVGTLIESSSKLLSARPQTIAVYSQAFRCMVAEIKNIKSGNKANSKKERMIEWRKKIDAVPLSSISPTDIIAWKNERLRASESDALAKRRAIVTVNAIIRNSKALFGKKILPFIAQTLPLPDPLPFDGIKLEKAPSGRYISQIDPFAILALAKKELAISEPEAFKALVLALVCGLRRSEIDNLLWRAFDFQNSVLKIESSEFHELKSEDSAGTIDLDVETLALFKKLRAQNPTALFVIESPVEAKKRLRAGGVSYRCNRVFVTLIAWLKKQGVNTQKPIHTLRKEIGSIIASEHGIFEASRYLRHSDIQITAAIYADKKKIVTPKIFSGIL